MTRQRVHGFAAFLLAVLVSGTAGAAPVSVRMRLSDLDGPLLVNGVPTPVPGDLVFDIELDTSSPDLEPTIAGIGIFAVSAVRVSVPSLGISDESITSPTVRYFEDAIPERVGIYDPDAGAVIQVVHAPASGSIGDPKIIEEPLPALTGTEPPSWSQMSITLSDGTVLALATGDQRTALTSSISPTPLPCEPPSCEVLTGVLFVDGVASNVSLTLDAVARDTQTVSISGSLRVRAVERDGELTEFSVIQSDLGFGNASFSAVVPDLVNLSASGTDLEADLAWSSAGITPSGGGVVDVAMVGSAKLHSGTISVQGTGPGDPVDLSIDLSLLPIGIALQQQVTLARSANEFTVTVPLALEGSVLADPLLTAVELSGSLVLSGTLAATVPTVSERGLVFAALVLVALAALVLSPRFLANRNPRTHVVSSATTRR